jgi:hypothetical protein
MSATFVIGDLSLDVMAITFAPREDAVRNAETIAVVEPLCDRPITTSSGAQVAAK